jgi:hypothetical protein
MGAVALPGQEALESRQQKRAKLTAAGVRRLQIFFLQKLGEERLRQVLGIIRGRQVTAGIGVEGIPVNAAQGRQRFSSSAKCADMLGHSLWERGYCSVRL